MPWDLLHLFSLMTTASVTFQPCSYILPNKVKSSWYQFLIPRWQQVPALKGCSARWGIPQEPPSLLRGLPWAIPPLWRAGKHHSTLLLQLIKAAPRTHQYYSIYLVILVLSALRWKKPGKSSRKKFSEHQQNIINLFSEFIHFKIPILPTDLSIYD